MKAQNVIDSSAMMIAARASGQSLTSAEYTDCLQALNDMLDAWTAQSLMIFTTQPSTQNLVAGTQSYTCGSGGVFNIARPPKIDRIVLKVNSNPSFPLELPLKTFTDEEWASITLKTLSNTYPEGYWDDGGFPLRTLYFWPVPSTSLQVVIYPWVALSQFADLATTDYTFPPGYAEALRFNLCLRLGPYLNVTTIPDVVMAMAQESRMRIKMMNANESLLTCDRAIQSPSTIPGVSRADFLGGRF